MARQLEKQDELVRELEECRAVLKRVVDLGLSPDLDDGVVLNTASLRELVPWPEEKKCVDDRGAWKYPWSSIAQLLREKGLLQDGAR